MYRVGVVGCRARGLVISTAYHAHPRTEVVGLVDRVPERLNKLGDLLDVPARFSGLSEMIESVSPDIVVIATGTEYHYELAMEALEYGVHVDVEKPFCVDLVQADALVAKAKEKSVVTAIHHQGRSGPALRAVAKAYREGRIGELRHATATEKGYYAGYGIMNIGTHLLNAMIEITGHAREVTAIGTTHGRPVEPHDVVQAPGGMGIVAGEYITATYRFNGSVTGTLRQHRFAEINPDADAIEFCGEEGRLFWHESGRAFWLPYPHFIPGDPRCEWRPLELEYPDHYDPKRILAPIRDATIDEYCYVDELVAALDRGSEHSSSFSEGRHVLEMIMGAFESIAYRRTVSLPQERRDHPLLRWRAEHGLGIPEERPRLYNDWLAEEDRRHETPVRV